MNKLVVGLGAGVFVLALLIPSVFGLAAITGPPPLSVAEGNVYDIYSTTPGGVTTLVASCSTFDQMLSLQAANPSNNYSAIPDSSCGPIVLVTSTVVSSTTFSNAVTTCPPLLPGYSIICNNTTYTNTATTTSTITVNSTSTATQTTTTTQIVLTTSSSTVTTTATKLGGGAGQSTTPNFPNYGELVGALILVVGAVYKKRR